MIRTTAFLFCFLFCLLAALPGAASGQEKAVDGRNTIHWASNLDAAMLEAKKNNIPVFLALHSAGNPRCAEIMEKIFSDPAVVAESRKFLCLAASPDEHGDVVMRDSDGIYRTVCDHFLHINCADHQRIWSKARRSFLSNRVVDVPQHLFVHPDGTIIQNIRDFKSPADLLKAMARALKKLDPERSDDVFNALDENERRFVKELRRLRGSDPSLRRFVLEKLVRREGRWVYPKLIKWSETVASRPQTIQLIREMGFEQNYRAEEWLLSLSRRKDREFRLHAAVSLEMIGSPNRGAEIRAWLEREKDERVEAALLRTLAVCDGRNPKTIERIEKEFRAGKPDARRNAAVALGLLGIHYPERARKTLKSLVSDKNPNVAACACWALGWMRSTASLDLLMKKMDKASTYRMIILLEDAINRIAGHDTFGYTRHLKRFAGDEIIRGEKWPPERRNWGLEER